MKSLSTILEEHRQAMAEIEKKHAEKQRIEKAQAEAADKERAKVKEDWAARARQSQEQAAALRAEALKLYPKIETWLDETSISFEKNEADGSATLTVDKVRILFGPSSTGPKELQVGVAMSLSPWHTAQNVVGYLALHDGAWYWRRQTSVRPLDQSEFNELLESCLKIGRKPIG
jgi:hypothetical protein